MTGRVTVSCRLSYEPDPDESVGRFGWLVLTVGDRTERHAMSLDSLRVPEGLRAEIEAHPWEWQADRVYRAMAAVCGDPGPMLAQLRAGWHLSRSEP